MYRHMMMYLVHYYNCVPNHGIPPYTLTFKFFPRSQYVGYYH